MSEKMEVAFWSALCVLNAFWVFHGGLPFLSAVAAVVCGLIVAALVFRVEVGLDFSDEEESDEDVA